MKILFVCNNLKIGGIQKSLINLLKNIRKDHQIDLLVFNFEGAYINDIPKEVNILSTNKYLQLLGSEQREIKNKSRAMYILRGLLVIFSRIFDNSIPRKIIYSTYSNLKGYDLAISFTQDISEKRFAVGCNGFVLGKVKSRIKVAFIHSDFRNYEGDIKKSHSVYTEFDKIACVSNGCRDAFLSVNTDLTTKTEVVYNFVDYNEIITKANQGTMNYNKDYFNIVTVARISKEKGVIRGILAIRKLALKGYKVKWHIVGDGELLSEAKLIVENYGISDVIKFYGSDDNPYRYMKNADLFMLTSFHEAAPIVFDEAQALKIPILTTDTISANEMVKDRQSGYVCENSYEGLIKSLSYVLDNRKELDSLYFNIPNNNSRKIEQFNHLFELNV